MDYLATIRYGRFWCLWSSQILSQVAFNLLNFSLIINVYNTTGGQRYSNIVVSLLVLSYGLPSILFAAVAGTLVDRWDKRFVLLACNVARGGLALLYILVGHNLWLILLLTFIISTISQFFVPAESASIPKLVPRERLLTANSLFIFSLYTSFIVGYAVAAPVIALFGETGPYILTAGMFTVAGIVSFGLPKFKIPKGFIRKNKEQTFWEEFRLGIKLIRSERWLGFSIRQLTLTQGIVTILMTLAPALSLAILHLPLQHSSQFLIIPAGAGMVFGVLIVQRLSKRWTKVRIIEAGTVVAGMALTLLGATGLLYRRHNGHQIIPYGKITVIVAILVFVLGMINAIISSTAQTVLHENSSEESRGKIFGTLNMFINLAATVPILITGTLASFLSVTEVITLIGLIVVLYALFQLRQMTRDRKLGLLPD